MKPTNPFRYVRLVLLGLPLMLWQPAIAQDDEESRDPAAEESEAAEEAPRVRQRADDEEADSEPTQDADELPGGDPDQPEESPREPAEPPTTPGDDRQGNEPPPAAASGEESGRTTPTPAERARERAGRPEDRPQRGAQPDRPEPAGRGEARSRQAQRGDAGRGGAGPQRGETPRPERGGDREPSRPGEVEPPLPEPAAEDEGAAETTGTPEETGRGNVVPSPDAPLPEPVRQAENEVRETTREVERTLRQREIRGEEEAQAVIDQILGAESRISQAEIAREERFRREMRQAREEVATVEQRREAARYFRQRLRGEAVDAAQPELLLLSERRRPGRRTVVEERVEQRVDVYRPLYLVGGRRYVHFDNRSSVPAILLAAGAMNRVLLQPAREVAPILYERREVREALPPAEYRDESAWVVSYPVDEKSMITSDDILFQQGSTQFADPYSYEIVSALGDAMKDLPDNERFVIEGHASAEGSYDSNMVLSQQRAERIVREMVRRGVSPNRLLPVGYGESEARHPENAREALRSQDRRVVVFRLNEQPTASR